jgi:hypothetical protein
VAVRTDGYSGRSVRAGDVADNLAGSDIQNADLPGLGLDHVEEFLIG